MNPYVQLAIYLVAIGLLLVLSGLFSCADMVYSVVSTKRLELRGTSTSLLAARLAKDYEKTIVAILFGNNLVNILASSLGAALTRLDIPTFTENPDMWALVVEFSLLFIILVFGEILPKVVGKAYSFRLALFFAHPVHVTQFVFYPFVMATTFIATKITGPLVSKVKDENAQPSNEELQAMVDTIEEEGIIDEDQSEMLASAIEFKDTCAHEIMTPRIKVEGFEIHDNLYQQVQRGAFKHSRIIVYEKDLDHVLGYLPLKDVQRALLRGERIDVKEAMIPILSVPPTMEISLVLKAMKQSRHHIVLVKDEYGGNEGILTMEDILEELVGEMFDESEPIREEVEKTDKRNTYRVKGSMHIEDFFEYFHIDEEELDEDSETLSGWISGRLGRFAKEGDMVTVGKVDVVVEKASPYTTEEAMVYYHPRRKVAD
ncbi:MAG: hemolysin family protein [Bacilli bacterium]|nr:hemolysin family protein [Bacilli bacterium]